jgi:hypothetical protein
VIEHGIEFGVAPFTATLKEFLRALRNQVYVTGSNLHPVSPGSMAKECLLPG